MTIVGLVSEGVKRTLNILYGSAKGDGYKASLGLTVQPVVNVNQGIRTIITGSSAGNVNNSINPPSGKIWHIVGGHIKLVNDATVANRVIYIGKYINGTLNNFSFGSQNITASSTGYLTLEPVNFTSYVASVGNGNANVKDIEYFYDSPIGINCGNGVAGDTLSWYLIIREFDVKND